MWKFARHAGAALAASAAFLPLAAMALPASSQMTCSQAATLVRTGGAVVLSTSATTYDRYVISRQFCPADQALDPAWVPTRNNPQCFVGYTCFDPTRDRR